MGVLISQMVREPFHDKHTYQDTMMYPLNILQFVSQLYLSKTENK